MNTFTDTGIDGIVARLYSDDRLPTGVYVSAYSRSSTNLRLDVKVMTQDGLSPMAYISIDLTPQSTALELQTLFERLGLYALRSLECIERNLLPPVNQTSPANSPDFILTPLTIKGSLRILADIAQEFYTTIFGNKTATTKVLLYLILGATAAQLVNLILYVLFNVAPGGY